MVAIVISINILLSVFFFWCAWRLWCWKRVLSQFATRLIRYEQCTYRTLNNAPAAILNGQAGTRDLRLKYQRLEQQIQQVQKLLALLSLVQIIWTGRLKRFRLR